MLSEQAIISLTIALAHAALLGYLIVKKGLKDFQADILLGYLALATGWSLLIFTQVNQPSDHAFGLTGDLAFIGPLALMAMVVWSFTLTFLDSQIAKRWFVIGGSLFLTC
jgi:hypothetical protein